MGFLSDLAKSAKNTPQSRGAQLQRSPTDRGDGLLLWSQVFGTDKESGSGPRAQVRPDLPTNPGGSWGRSMVSGEAAYKRLLQAMRSMAPGGWSDDRWQETQSFTGPVYTAIRTCCEQMGRAEFQVWHKDPVQPDGKRPVVKGEDAYGLVELLENPNNEDTFGDLIYGINLQMDLTGTALTWMVPNIMGRPYELYVVPTATAIPQPAVNPDYPDGYWRIQPVYPYGPFSSYPTPASAVGAAIPAQWMLRIKYVHPLLRYDGYSPLSALRMHVDEVNMIDKSRHTSMRRGVHPSAVLNMEGMEEAEPMVDDQIERIRAEFESVHQGPENLGQLFVATPGCRLDPWGMPAADMEYQSGWEQLVSYIMGTLGVTRQAAGMIDESSYSTLFATLKQLYWITIEPKLERIGAKLTKQLCPFFGDDLFIEVRAKRIDDHEVKLGKLSTAMQAMAITKNEIRHELDLPLTQEPWGNDIAGLPPQMMADPMKPGAPTPDELDEPMLEIEEIEKEDREIEEEMYEQQLEASRPVPGQMGRGSMGPEMGTVTGKSLYDAVRRACANGTH